MSNLGININKVVSSEKTGLPIYIKAIVYSLPVIGFGIITAPVNFVLAGIMAKYYGLALTTIASVILLARIFDAVMDPVVGYYSDRWQERTGNRKAFFVVGGMLLIPCSYYLYVPPEDIGTAYFAFWYISFYLGFTIFVIPYVSWASDFTKDSKEKTLVFSVFQMSMQGATALFFLIPFLPFFVTTEVTPETLKAAFIVGSVVLITGLLLVFKLIPDRPRTELVEVLEGKEKTAPLLIVVNALLSNKPFLVFIGAFVFVGVGGGMWFGMFFIYVDHYLKMGADFAIISLWGGVAAALGIPVWYRSVTLLGKRKVWLFSNALLVIMFLFTGLLSPGSTGFIGLFAVTIIIYFVVSGGTVVTLPLLCDTVDYGRLKETTECTAAYFSIQSLVTKIQFAVGGALAFAIAGWFGFDVSVSEVTGRAVTGIHIAMSWIPALFISLAMVFILRLPLDERRMAIIRKRLAQREHLSRIKI